MSAWTEADDAQLYELFIVQRMEAGAVAKLMGRASRSAILGRANRKGWVRRELPPPARRMWTEADRAVLIGHLDAGLNRREIAKQFGCTEQSVKHLIIKWGLSRASDFWTAARVDQLKALYAAGQSYSEIGQAMGVKRGVISGKAHRLGLTAPNSSRAIRSQRLSGRKPKPLVRRDPTPLLAPEEVGPVKLLDLQFHHCRWPLAMHDGERTFCGRQRAHELTSYCAEHRAQSVTAFKPTQAKNGSQLIRQLRRYAA